VRHLILILSFLFAAVGAHAQSRSELEDRRKKTLEEIEYVDNLLKQTTKEKTESLGQLSILSRKMNLRSDIIEGLREEIELLEYRIELNSLAISLMEDDLELLIKEYEKAIMHAQRVSKGQPEIAYIFSAKDLNQGYKRLRHLQQVAKYRRREAEVIRELKDIIGESKSRQEQDLKNIIELRATEERQLAALKGEQQNKTRLVTNLGKKERQLRQDLLKKRRIAEEIEKEIARVIEEENRRRARADLTPEEQLIGDDFAKNMGRLPWPVERGIITSQFGVHDHPVFKGTKVDNIGIEITAGERVQARAVFGGRIMSVFGIPGGNLAVIIRHGKYLTVYQNLVNVSVKQGDNVLTKQVIGEVFSDPNEGGKSTIKFMVYEEKIKKNPEEWIAKKQ